MRQKRFGGLAVAAGLVLWAGQGLAQIQTLDSSGGPSVGGAAAPAPRAADPAPEPIPCGTEDFTIAEMGWPSAAILAYIHAAVLRAEFDCTVRLVPGEQEATLSSIATTRQPAVAPEMWISQHADIWNGAMRARSARAAGPTFSGGPLEAWFVPSYVVESHPGLDSAAELIDYWQVFVPEGASRARLVSCPRDWACSLFNTDMVSAFKLSERFEVFEPADRFEMDSTISEAVARREGVLAYYWQPNGLIDRLDLVPLDMGAFDVGSAQCMALANCVPFSPSAFVPQTVVIAVAEWVFNDAPEVAAYFQRATMPLEEMNRLLAWQIENDASPEAVAQFFLITGREIWQSWAGKDVVPEPLEEPEPSSGSDGSDTIRSP